MNSPRISPSSSSSTTTFSSNGRKPLKVVRFSLTDSNATDSSSGSDNDNHRRVKTYNYKNEIYGEEEEEVEQTTITTTSSLGTCRRSAKPGKKYRGVRKTKTGEKWRSEILDIARGKQLYIGSFDTAKEAAVAYDREAIRLRGPNALTNFHYTQPLVAAEFASYGGDCDSQVQKVGKRPLVGVSDAQLLMHFLNAIREQSLTDRKESGMNLETNLRSEISSLPEFVYSNGPCCRMDEVDICPAGSSENVTCSLDSAPELLPVVANASKMPQVAAYAPKISPLQPAPNYNFGRTTGTKQKSLNQDLNNFTGYLPPSFTALLTICSAEAKKGKKLPVPEEIDTSLKSRVKRHITEIATEETITLSAEVPSNRNGILKKEICGEKKKKSSNPYLNSVGDSGGAKNYRGVRQTSSGKWRAMIQDPLRCKLSYLGTFITAEEAAIAFDKEAIRLRGPNAVTNFVYAEPEPEPLVVAECHLPQESSIAVSASSGDCDGQDSQALYFKKGTMWRKKEICGKKKKKSSNPYLNSVGDGGGAKKYRGVTQTSSGNWRAIIQDPLRRKLSCLGTFITAEEAATAFDKEAIRLRGPNAVTNFVYAQPEPEPEPPVVAECHLPQESSIPAFASGDRDGQEGRQESLADSMEIGMNPEISVLSDFDYSNEPCSRVDEVNTPTESFMDVTFLPKLLPVASYTPELPADATFSPKMPQIAKTYQSAIVNIPMLSSVAAAPKTQPFRTTILETLHAPKKNYSAKAFESFVVSCLPVPLHY